MKNSCQIVIPARLASSRLSEKLLQFVAGKSILQHTYESALQATTSSSVVVAVDDPKLAELCDSFGAPWLMTSPNCPSGTDRIAEAAEQLQDADVFVNVQGDEPEIDPQAIDAVANLLLEHPGADMATAGTPIRSLEMLEDPSIVKIVMGEIPGNQTSSPATRETPAQGIPAQGIPAQGIPAQETPEQGRAEQGRAIYFSRAAVPFDRGGSPEKYFRSTPPIYWHHLGLYAYRRDFLNWFAEEPPASLEQVERLEQLRAIQAGKTILVTSVGSATPGIDTQSDLDAFRKRIERDS